MAKDMYQKRKERQENIKNETYEEKKTNINWYPGHMAKTKKEILQDLKLIDIVIELLDARIPKASQNPDVFEMTKNKKRLIVLNKSDLSDEKENAKWVNFFKSKNISVILTDSVTGRGINNLLSEIEKICKEDMEKYINKGITGKRIRAMILGIPNVGKSSIINRIIKKNSLEVANKPGVTRVKKWVRINQKVDLLDTPGVLWPKIDNDNIGLNLAYTGSIKDTVLDVTEIAFFLVQKLYRDYIENLKDRYKLTDKEIEGIEYDDVTPLIETIARKRGAIISGGNIDLEKISRIIVDDLRSGKLGRITLEKVGE